MFLLFSDIGLGQFEEAQLGQQFVQECSFSFAKCSSTPRIGHVRKPAQVHRLKHIQRPYFPVEVGSQQFGKSKTDRGKIVWIFGKSGDTGDQKQFGSDLHSPEFFCGTFYRKLQTQKPFAFQQQSQIFTPTTGEYHVRSCVLKCKSSHITKDLVA